MTGAPHVPPVVCRDLGEAVGALRARGLRLSTSRRLVLQALFDSRQPLAAEEIARLAELEPSGVYRNLEALEHLGLVRHVHLGHGPGRYSLTGASEREYLCCERCGAAHPLSPGALDPVRELVRSHFGFRASFTHFPIVGLCPACSAAAERT